MPKKKQKRKSEYVFRSADFYEMLEKQEYRCPLTGRTLTPENCTAEHIQPLRLGGAHVKDNIFLVDRDVAKLKRYLSEDAIIELAIDIIKSKGRDYGIELRKKRKL